MNLSNPKMKLFIALAIAIGLAYRFVAPYMAETAQIEAQAAKLHKGLDELKRQAANFDQKWENEVKVKEQAAAEQLPTVINSSATLNYLLNQFEKANSATVHFISASHQFSVANEFKIAGTKGNISPRVSRYKLRSRMKQALVVPYLQHIENFGPTHNLESMSITLPKERDPSLELEVTVGVYLTPKEWIPKGTTTRDEGDELDSNTENWLNWFQDSPTPKQTKKGLREVATATPTGPKTIRFKISNIVGEGVVVDESIYEEGDYIQGWQVLKVNGSQRSVVFKSGTVLKTVYLK